jgi:TRAP-type C4-dicarboxylate transport system permease small subunit
MHRSLRTISALLASVALWASGIGLVLMTLAVAWQVFGRYVLNSTPTWTEALSIQLMGWFILLGAAVGVREGYHLGFDILRIALPGLPARLMALVSHLVVLAFGLAMVWYGWDLVVGTWTATIPILGWPGGIDFLPLLGGGVLISLFTLEHLYNLATGRADGSQA